MTVTTQKHHVDAAIAEARRFITRAEKALEVESRTQTRDYDRDGFVVCDRWPNGLPDAADITYTKESAAMRRSSLDLTRALADLRRRNR